MTVGTLVEPTPAADSQAVDADPAVSEALVVVEQAQAEYGKAHGEWLAAAERLAVERVTGRGGGRKLRRLEHEEDQARGDRDQVHALLVAARDRHRMAQERARNAWAQQERERNWPTRTLSPTDVA
jgi:hypothetical protein